MRQGWSLDKKASNGTGESVYTNVNFGTVPRLPVPILPPGGTFSAPQTFWALVPHFIWESHVYTSKIWSAVPKNGQHGAKNVPRRADFLRV